MLRNNGLRKDKNDWVKELDYEVAGVRPRAGKRRVGVKL